MDNLINQTIRLKDGRVLGYAETGDLQGKPVFYFHGLPGSRLESQLAHESANKTGVHLIAPDRPGAGLSDFQPDRTFLDWPKDVVELAQALKLEQFGVMGVSGGGPYVAACTYKIPERLTWAGIVAGVGPLTEPGSMQGMHKQNIQVFSIARRFPLLLHLLFNLQMRGDLEKKLPQVLKSLPEPDRKVLEGNPEVAKLFIQGIKEAFRQGTRGAVQETALYARPWGFNLKDIPFKVYLWQGEMDKNVPPAMGHYQARTLPNCEAKFFAEEGHISLIFNHMDEILSRMV
jgi:pimeloyl-ACP methyl ester carboxylesterase